MKTPPRHNTTAKQADYRYSELQVIPKGWLRLRQNEIIRTGDKVQVLGKWEPVIYEIGDRVRWARIIRKIKTKSK